MIYRLGSRSIETKGQEFYIAPSSIVIGSVRLGSWASIWFGAILRGDSDVIDIGDGTNIQDGTIMHTDAGVPLAIGTNVTVGHGALLHGCTIGDSCLIAGRAMILDGAVIGSNTIIAAGAVITPGKSIPAGVVVMGSPGKVVRELSANDRQLIADGAEHYQHRAREYRADLKRDERW